MWLTLLLCLLDVPSFRSPYDVDLPKPDGDVDLRDYAAFQNGDHIDSGYLGDYAAFAAWMFGPGCDAFATRYQGRKMTVFCSDRIFGVDFREVN